MTASPVGQPPCRATICLHASRMSGPPRRWIAPSTPPPPSSVELAAFTIASTRCSVISPVSRVRRAPPICSVMTGSRDSTSWGIFRSREEARMREYLKKAVPRPPEDDAAVRQTVSEILGAVRERGDKAVREWSERLDRWAPPAFRLSQSEIESAIGRVSVEDRRVIDYCRDQIAAFARLQRESLREFDVELQPGVHLGQRLIPVQSVGAYVPEAKRQSFGAVGIDLLAGPTEILVIADDSADASVLACDHLGQAEHGPTSPAILITTSRALGDAVVYECER